MKVRWNERKLKLINNRKKEKEKKGFRETLALKNTLRKEHNNKNNIEKEKETKKGAQ